LVTKIFTPLMTQSSPSRTATVFVAPASEPACGSVRQYAPSWRPEASGLRKASFCSSLPYVSSGWQTRELFTDMMTPVEAQPREISSSART